MCGCFVLCGHCVSLVFYYCTGCLGFMLYAVGCIQLSKYFGQHQSCFNWTLGLILVVVDRSCRQSATESNVNIFLSCLSYPFATAVEGGDVSASLPGVSGDVSLPSASVDVPSVSGETCPHCPL